MEQLLLLLCLLHACRRHGWCGGQSLAEQLEALQRERADEEAGSSGRLVAALEANAKLKRLSREQDEAIAQLQKATTHNTHTRPKAGRQAGRG